MSQINFTELIKKYWYAIPIIILLALFMFKKKRGVRRRRPRYRGRFISRRRGSSTRRRKLKFGSPAWRKKYLRKGRRRRKKAS